uniref:UDP-glucuronosyltransferase n=1 Tax=Panagrolaimus superbus TaxID=310955 RepID=A0A914XUU2_9BILA
MKFKSFHLFLILAILFCSFTNAYKIGILIPDISRSQLLFNQRMGEVLADAGHNVTLIRLQTLENDGKGLKLSSRPTIDEWIINGFVEGVDYEWIKEKQAESAFKDESAWTFLSKEKRHLLSVWMKTFTDACEKMITDKEFMAKFEAAEFDVVFTHMYDFCPIGMQFKGKAKTWVWVNSGALMDYVAFYMGLPVPPSYAAPMMTDAHDSLTFYQRFKSILGHTLSPIFSKKMLADPQTEIFQKHFGPNFPHLTEIAKDAPLVFVNSNELYDLPRPTLHKIVNIGGLGMKAASTKPLPKEYSKLIEKVESVVVFSFGSVANATLMPVEWKQAFMGAFSKFPNTQFFVRYEGADIEPPKNVYFSHWLPQVDLLQHPKTRAFITHGGFNSLQEAILASQPIISIPLFGDQFRNGRIAEKHGFGIVLSKSEINENAISEAIGKKNE